MLGIEGSPLEEIGCHSRFTGSSTCTFTWMSHCKIVYRHKLAAEHFDALFILSIVEDTVRIRAFFFTAFAGPAGLAEQARID